MHYKSRKVFFENLISFCDHLSIEISFSKNITLQVIERYYKTYSRHFQSLLQGYSNLLTDKQDITYQNITTLMWNKLKAHEISIITEFFYELGRHGAIEEGEKLENKKIQFDGFLKNAQTAQKKEASIYLKICIILGIAAVILLI
ncbi:MAG: hypothetical protein FWE01_02555 [Firmicutes bacterium]|nr:hypothetical protein [Bacillota bacterium]